MERKENMGKKDKIERAWKKIRKREKRENNEQKSEKKKKAKGYNGVVITSIIDPPKLRLHTTKGDKDNPRSVFSKEERYEQLKKTIESVREKVPDSYIILVECSELTSEQLKYLSEKCNRVMNLYGDSKKKELIYSPYKSIGDITQTIFGFSVIKDIDTKKKSIFFKSISKISGRYWLNEKFDEKKIYDNEKIIVKGSGLVSEQCTCRICGTPPEVTQSIFYKLPLSFVERYIEFSSREKTYMRTIRRFSLEVSLSKFANMNSNYVNYVSYIGVSGYHAPTGKNINY